MNVTPLMFLPIGKGHYLQVNRIVAVVRPGSQMNKRILSRAKKEGRYLDWTSHAVVKSLILLEDGKVIGCMFSPNTVYNRICREIMNCIFDPNDLNIRRTTDELDDAEAEIDDENDTYEDYAARRDEEEYVLSKEEYEGITDETDED